MIPLAQWQAEDRAEMEEMLVIASDRAKTAKSRRDERRGLMGMAAAVAALTCQL